METTSTGHRAGLQSAEDLLEREKDLKRQRDLDVEKANRQQVIIISLKELLLKKQNVPFLILTAFLTYEYQYES